MVGACGSDDCAEGRVLTDDGSGARKLFHSSEVLVFTCPVPSRLGSTGAPGTYYQNHADA